MRGKRMEKYLRARSPGVMNFVQNGLCRFVAADSDAPADEYGFSAGETVPRTEDFLPCIWAAKPLKELNIAEQTRAAAGYEITIAQKINGSPVVVSPSDILELKLDPSADAITRLEIVARLNSSNIFWRIIAVDIDDEN